MIARHAAPLRVAARKGMSQARPSRKSPTSGRCTYPRAAGHLGGRVMTAPSIVAPSGARRALPARKRDPTVSAGSDIDIAEPLPCIGRRITARDSRPSTLSSTSSVRRRRLIRY